MVSSVKVSRVMAFHREDRIRSDLACKSLICDGLRHRRDWTCSCSNTRHGNSGASRSLVAEGASLMATSPLPPGSATPVSKPVPPKISTDEAVPRRGARWQSYITPILVVILALAVLITITRNWNAWEGGRIEQVTDDAYVRGDLTPLIPRWQALCAR